MAGVRWHPRPAEQAFLLEADKGLIVQEEFLTGGCGDDGPLRPVESIEAIRCFTVCAITERLAIAELLSKRVSTSAAQSGTPASSYRQARLIRFSRGQSAAVPAR